MNILNIATILPYMKINENDVIYKNSENIEKLFNHLYFYFRPIPYSNKILAILSNKWKKYNELPSEFTYKNKQIIGIKGLKFPKSRFVLISSFTFVHYNKKLISDFLKKNHIDLCHAHYIFPDGLLAKYIKDVYGIPYVLTIRNESKYFKNRFSKKEAIKICEGADSITAVNKIHIDKIGGYINKKITLIPHWIKNEEFFYNIGINKTIKILVVSNLIKRKNVDVVIKALINVPKSNYSISIIGSGIQLKQLKNLAKISNIDVDFLGKLEYRIVQKYMRESDIFILPSENETFGRVYIEALSTSNAVIGLKNNGLWNQAVDEIIFLSSPNIQELNKNINMLLKNHELIKEYKRKGYMLAKRKFSEEVCVNMYNQLYNQVQKGFKDE